MSGGTTQAGPVSLASLPVGYRALVVGARGGIGAAFVQALQADPRCGAVVGLHRASTPALDLADEASVAAAAAALAPTGRFHLVINAVGVAKAEMTLSPARQVRDKEAMTTRQQWQ